MWQHFSKDSEWALPSYAMGPWETETCHRQPQAIMEPWWLWRADFILMHVQASCKRNVVAIIDVKWFKRIALVSFTEYKCKRRELDHMISELPSRSKKFSFLKAICQKNGFELHAPFHSLPDYIKRPCADHVHSVLAVTSVLRQWRPSQPFPMASHDDLDWRARTTLNQRQNSDVKFIWPTSFGTDDWATMCQGGREVS